MAHHHRLWCVLVVSYSAACSGGPFIGFSSSQVPGGAGLGGMNAVCQDDLGTDSRVCFSEEIFKSGELSGAPNSGSAWVHPTIRSAVSDGASVTVFDFSGVSTTLPGGMACNGWTESTPGFHGLTVLSGFSFKISACGPDLGRNVACCRTSSAFSFPEVR